MIPHPRLLSELGWDEDSLDMPPIDLQYMKTAVYLYGSIDNAQKDSGFVATGFIVSLDAPDLSGYWNSLVTNYHVVDGCKSNVCARLSKINGGTMCIPIPKNHWVLDKDNDLAVAALNLPSGMVSYARVGLEHLVTTDFMTEHKIGPGDEVYLISRTVTGTKQTRGNFGSVRFGNVAMNPNEHEPYFLIELRSVGGHSGSPVFVYDLPYHWDSARKKTESFKIMLLGVNCGHIVDYAPILSRTTAGQIIENPKWVAEHHVAIAKVEPAWKLIPLLNCKEFTGARERSRKTAKKKLERRKIVNDGTSLPRPLVSEKSEPEQ